MIEKILEVLKSGLPTAAALKGIASADPRLKSFIYAASAAGYGADAMMDFFKDITSDTSKESLKSTLYSKKASRTARPDELASISELESGEGAERLLKKGFATASGLAAAARAGSPVDMVREAAKGALGAGGEAEQEQQKKKRSFVEMALEGISFFDLPEKIKPSVGKLTKRLVSLESEGADYEDQSVQKIVKSLRKLVDNVGLVESESQRFEKSYGSAPKRASTDEEFMSLLDEFSKRYLS